MSDLNNRIESLSPEKRALLELRLKKRAARPRAFPLSFAQQRLWFLYLMQPEEAFYNMPAAVRLRGPLDSGALERAFGEVVARHDALRTTFEFVEGRPTQIVAPAGGWKLTVVDLTATPAAEREDEALRLARAQARGPFDVPK